MNGIIGMTDLALETSLAPEQRDLLETVKYSGQSLLAIINNILDFSKIEAGKLTLDPQPFNLRKLMTNTVAIMRPRAEDKHLQIICEVFPGVPEIIRGDELRIGQVLLNLLGNAVKFTPPSGGILLQVQNESTADEAEAGMISLHFVVSDSGIGIPLEKLDHIFEPFAQADASTTRRFGGTGLGLAICKNLAEIMGGELWVLSQPSVGSAFHFRLTLQSETDSGTTTCHPHCEFTPGQVSSGFSILLAEDNKPNQKYLVTLLEKHGHAVTLAEDGKQAVEAFSLRRVARPFDIIIMDCQMPVMDGFEATQAIREIEKHSGSHVPIMALTAHAMIENREKCLRMGMDEFLAKPVDGDKLLAMIRNLCAKRPWLDNPKEEGTVS